MCLGWLDSLLKTVLGWSYCHVFMLGPFLKTVKFEKKAPCPPSPLNLTLTCLVSIYCPISNNCYRLSYFGKRTHSPLNVMKKYTEPLCLNDVYCSPEDFGHFSKFVHCTVQKKINLIFNFQGEPLAEKCIF